MTVLERPIDLTAPLEPVTLAELDRAQLHDRVESKVIFHANHLETALQRLADDYLVLDHEGQRRQRYLNEYFDTPDRRTYREHHNQYGRRFKLRYRSYVNSDLTYFEVKTNANGRTVKDRRRSTRPDGSMHSRDGVFFFTRSGCAPSRFVPSLTVAYDRILLVKRDFSERVTFDFDLGFSTDRGTATMPGLVICEFKQPRLDRRSPAMSAVGCRPQMFSKYCMGLASCEPDLVRNRFKKVFRDLDRIGVTPETTRRTTARTTPRTTGGASA